MTNDTTPAPIGADAALAQLRHLYRNLIEGGVRDTAQAKRIAEGLLAPAIAVLERAALASAAQPASAPAAVAGSVMARNRTKDDILHFLTKEQMVEEIIRLDAALAAAPTTQAAPQREVFDEDGFRAWVIRNLPDNTIIGNSAWWADHLAAWMQRFMLAAPQAAPVAQGDAEQRAMDTRHAAIYRWIIQHTDEAAGIIDAWREDGEADTDELHDALAARTQAKEGQSHE